MTNKKYFLFRVTGVCLAGQNSGESVALFLQEKLQEHFGVNTIFIEPSDVNHLKPGGPTIEIVESLDVGASPLEEECAPCR